jgi:hypothetical protein
MDEEICIEGKLGIVVLGSGRSSHPPLLPLEEFTLGYFRYVNIFTLSHFGCQYIDGDLAGRIRATDQGSSISGRDITGAARDENKREQGTAQQLREWKMRCSYSGSRRNREST